MKKAFEQNVSRVKPRVRLATMFTEVSEPSAKVEPASSAEAAPVEADLAAEIKARAERNRAPRATAQESVTRSLLGEALAPPPVSAPAAKAEPREEWVEVQTPPAPVPDVSERRERLKERLKAVRENPRPQPLPATVAETGVIAVERISTIQQELHQVRAQNLSLTQELEVLKRTAERATEEARMRMDEARRLSEEMAGRVKLLQDLETELSALESERDEVLLALQETRRVVDSANTERQQLTMALAEKDKALADSLTEEERLATELEEAKEESARHRQSVESLVQEKETLARQVADLSRERTELLDARKALEAVHRALSHAVSR